MIHTISEIVTTLGLGKSSRHHMIDRFQDRYGITGKMTRVKLDGVHRDQRCYTESEYKTIMANETVRGSKRQGKINKIVKKDVPLRTNKPKGTIAKIAARIINERGQLWLKDGGGKRER